MAVRTRSNPRHEAPKIGRFVVRRWLGTGLHGKVFLAFDPLLARQVAIKRLNPGHAPGGLAQSPVLPDEARIVASLEHPNIVPLYEAGVHGGFPYLVFAFVQGSTLKDGRALGLLPPAKVVSLVGAILDGVACAHARGVLHLDLSPANILIGADGVPRVTDFGLARLIGRSAAPAGVSPDGHCVAGTPRYMSPEHFEGRPLTARSDVFALGLILFELLVGRSPLQSGNLPGLIAEITGSELDLAALDTASIDPRLRVLVRRALRRDPGQRFSDAGEMRAALEELIEPSDGSGMHSTVKFLIKRLQRKASFPALSNSLLEIRRLTDDHGRSSVDALAGVVLRDYAVTKKLLKLANSTFYARGGSVRTVSGAIQLLGTNVVRMACSGFVVFDALMSGNRDLREALLGSFVAALLGRHLAMHLGRPDLAEEAFICGMFHRLGKSLAIFYLAEESAEVERLARGGGRFPEEASARVLGVGYGELGSAVARHWRFPETICASILAPAPGRLARPANVIQMQQQIAAFANELCELATQGSADPPGLRLVSFCGRFEALVPAAPEDLCELLRSALKKLEEFAPVLGVDPGASRFVEDAREFLAGTQAAAGLDPA